MSEHTCVAYNILHLNLFCREVVVVRYIMTLLLLCYRRSESPMAQVSSVSMPGQNPSIPPTGPSSSNPYRMSGGKKPAINTSLAYSVPSSSSPSIPPTQPPPSYPPGSQAPPTSHAHPLPPTHAESVAQPGGGLPGPLMQAHPRQGPIPSVIPVQPHWFYLRAGERYWFPFSIIDSMKLEEEFIRSQADPSRQVSEAIGDKKRVMVFDIVLHLL